MTGKNRELDFSAFPPGTVTEYTTLVCLACIFDIFTKQLGIAPRSAYSEIKRYTPSVTDQFEVLEKLVDEVAGSGPLKLYYVVDRREFLDKAKSVYERVR